MKLTVRLAQGKNEFEAALRLIQSARKRWLEWAESETEIWLPKQLALPSSNLIVALDSKSKVVGAVALIGDNPFFLPSAHETRFSNLRRSLDKQRFAELSFFGIEKAHLKQEANITCALHRFALFFGATYCQYQLFIHSAKRHWFSYYGPILGLNEIREAQEGEKVGSFQETSNSPDVESLLSQLQVDFIYPEKKYLLLVHESLTPEVFEHLFVKSSNFFHTISDFELRVLKNIYDFGPFSQLLPKRDLGIPLKKMPKSRRYALNCEGFLRMPDGTEQNLHVLDVSKDGLKIHHEEELPPGCHSLVLYVGLKKRAELIVNTVWSDETAKISGFEVKSGDANWLKLVATLEEVEKSLAA